MADKFFGIDIQAEIAAAMTASDMPNFTLTKIGIPTPGAVLSGPGTPATPVAYSCWGAVLDYTVQEMDLDATKNEPEDSPGVIQGDKKILIIAKPLADAGVTPEPGDVITLSSGKTYRVVDAKTDAATAKWICHTRGR